jgi:hypothetical protein
MVLIYPSEPKPNRINPVTTAPYKGSRSEFRDGNTQNVRTQFVSTGQTITLEYQAVTKTALTTVWDFWDLVGGMYGQSFLLTDSLFYHPTEVVARIVNPSSTYWRFNQEQLSVEVVVSSPEQVIRIPGKEDIVSPGCGIYNVNVELKSVIA